MTPHKLLASVCLSSLIAGSSSAAITPDIADRLGGELTTLGAELAGNADGSIPQWNAAGTPVPGAFVAGSDNYVNPYADEKPLYSIDGTNWQDYSDQLTVGSQAVKRLPTPAMWVAWTISRPCLRISVSNTGSSISW